MKKRYWRVFSDEQGESHAEEVDAEIHSPTMPPCASRLRFPRVMPLEILAVSLS